MCLSRGVSLFRVIINSRRCSANYSSKSKYWMSYYSRIQGDHGLLNAHDTPGKRQCGVGV